MSTVSALFILVCLCMDPSNARRLPTIHSNKTFQKQHFAVKADQDKVNDVLTQSTQQRSRNEDDKLDGNGVSSTMLPNPTDEMKTFHKKADKIIVKEEENSGSEIVESFHPLGSVKATKTEGSKWATRSESGKAEHFDNNNKGKDIVHLDYEPPHRKTPIHN